MMLRNVLCFHGALILKELINAVEPLSGVIVGVFQKLDLSQLGWKKLSTFVCVHFVFRLVFAIMTIAIIDVVVVEAYLN